MRFPRPIFIARAVICCLASGVGAQAASLSFPVTAIGFPASNLTFPVQSFALPINLDRVESSTTIEVVLPADILFDFDKADIRDSAASTLHDLAQIIREKAHGPVAVQGYTDSVGGDAYNQKLSDRRAAAVKNWLTSHEALTAKMLSTVGFGSRNPVAPNRRPDGSDDPEGRQQNRRVSVLIRK
jgi:outer membrane protein OmpA-like peptidoglycan-associated protein